MANRHDSERLRGFCDRLTDRQTDICDSRVAFVTEKSLLVCQQILLVKFSISACCQLMANLTAKISFSCLLKLYQLKVFLMVTRHHYVFSFLKQGN